MQQKRTRPWKLVSVALFITGLGVLNVFTGIASFILGICLMTSGIALLVAKGFR
jgi:hypothetical protein